jgi:hypothetical protein
MLFSLSSFKNSRGALDSRKILPLKNLLDLECFIETGTYLGDTVDEMCKVFDQVVSIELSNELFESTKSRFKGNSKVELLLGNSAEKLYESSIELAKKRPLIWLDAHWSGGNTARSSENTPVLAELKSLIKAGISDAIIIIDDIRYFIDIPSGFEVHEANSGYPKLKEIIDFVASNWNGHECILNGDMMFIVPNNHIKKIQLSDVLVASNNLRIGFGDNSDVLANEKIVATAIGQEKETILKLPEVYSHSLQYGIGGEYIYWRGLILESDGEFNRAAQDFQLARKCGIRVPSRVWE